MVMPISEPTTESGRGPTPAARGEVAERDADPDRDDHRDEGELDRGGEPVDELVQDRAARAGRDAEVPVRAAGPGTAVLHDAGAGRNRGCVDARERLRRAPLSQQGRLRAARQGAQPDEEQDRQPEQGREQQQPGVRQDEDGAIEVAVPTRPAVEGARTLARPRPGSGLMPVYRSSDGLEPEPATARGARAARPAASP